MELIDKIKNWAIKGDALTPADKAAIKKACTDAGLPVQFKTKCPNCYRDAVVQLYRHYSVGGDIPKPAIEGGVVIDRRFGYINTATATAMQWARVKELAPDVYAKYHDGHED